LETFGNAEAEELPATVWIGLIVEPISRTPQSAYIGTDGLKQNFLFFLKFQLTFQVAGSMLLTYSNFSYGRWGNKQRDKVENKWRAV